MTKIPDVADTEVGKAPDEVKQFSGRTHTKTTLTLTLDFFGVRNDLVDLALANNVHSLGRYIAQLLQKESASVLDAAVQDATKYSQFIPAKTLSKASFDVHQEEFNEREFQIMYGGLVVPNEDQLKN